MYLGEDPLEYDPRKRRYRRRAAPRRRRAPRRRSYRRRSLDPSPAPRVRYRYPRFTRARRAFGRARKPALSLMDAGIGLIAGALAYVGLNYVGKEVDKRYPPPA